MINIFKKLYFFIGLLLSISAYCAEENQCNVPELVTGSEKYNTLVCSGVEMMDRGDYKSAATTFESALGLYLNEVPNFYLFPRLAYVHSQLGDKPSAKSYLEKAEMSLKVYTGIYSCVEENGNYVISKTAWGKSYKVESAHNDAVSKIMCGEVYDYIYHPEELIVVLREAELVENYLNFSQKIN